MKYKAASSIIASHTRLFVGEQEGIIVDWLCAITHALLQSQKLYSGSLEFGNKMLFIWQYLKPDEIQFHELNGFFLPYFKGYEWWSS